MIGLVSNVRMHILGNSGSQCSEQFIVPQYFLKKIISPQEVNILLDSPPSLFIFPTRKRNISKRSIHNYTMVASVIHCKYVSILLSTNSTWNSIPPDAYPINPTNRTTFQIEISIAIILPTKTLFKTSRTTYNRCLNRSVNWFLTSPLTHSPKF